MIEGIPYFGENNNEITEAILNADYTKVIDCESMYAFITDNINNKIIVVIGDRLTWLNDIKFNYRDKECFIPYYDFKVAECEYRTSNKGHLIKKENKTYLRYEYKLEKFRISFDENPVVLRCYNLDTEGSFQISLKKWIKNEEEIDFEKLYKLYVESSYIEDNFLVNKHAGGYHYIMRSPDNKFKNIERKIREEYELNAYSPEHKIEREYRDVRNYKYSEVLIKYGLLESTELYRERRLRFESYLYSLIHGGKLNDIKFKNGIHKIGTGDIKLIIKDYWILDKDRPIKTWTRV